MPQAWAVQTQHQNLRTTAHSELESFSPADSSSQMKNESSCPHPASTGKLFLHTHTFAARERQQRNGFSGSSLHLFIFILSLTDEQHNGFGFPGCHKPRNILMKNKCIYRETSKQPKTSQSNVPVLGKSAFISLPLHGLRADHAVERDKYFK